MGNESSPATGQKMDLRVTTGIDIWLLKITKSLSAVKIVEAKAHFYQHDKIERCQFATDIDKVILQEFLNTRAFES